MRATGRRWRALLSGAGVATLMASPAFGDPTPEGVYLGLGGGVTFDDSGKVESGGVAHDLDTDVGALGLATVGYSFGSGLRSELEGGYRHNGVSSWGGADLDGDMSAWHAMVNALYEFDTGSGFTPYLGAGLGAAIVDIDARNDRTGQSLTDSDVGFAYQAIVGFGYDVTDGLALTADYRFFHAPDLEHDSSDGSVADGYANHAVVFGLRYAFGTGPAPARTETARSAEVTAPQVPVPPSVVPTSYLVFFTFDSAALSPQAVSIVDTAAQNALTVGKTRITVTGHTDRVGEPSYNMVLSQRRAASVMERLVSQGIPPEGIVVFARGEEEPLLPTADNVREPQNRRVEIYLM
ncbi:OmpA family protein [Roseospira marina]|nr:acyloxyacyl hydrolase [Roseospira marina]MBB4315251.1 outer membrane protein OmpA-like peptidoglycan-associated protein [Roseospira marina]MBB5088251.1 outer membrane protein OmpA-like peptidoglycan-associated protein [Roseospira marina]